VAVVDAAATDQALARWHALPAGSEAARIGTVENSHRHVVLETPLGGERLLEELEDDPLPRIC
jgi:hydrogenase expression/formation protein HypE